MTRRTWAVLAALSIGLSFSLTTAARAADPNASGTWKWTFQRPNGGDPVEITLKLKQDGEKLTGTITGPGGNETEIKDGKVTKDGDVSFKVERERDGNVFTTHYNGKLEGDAIKGKAKTKFGENERERDWEAKRAS